MAHKTVSHETWLKARQKLLLEEKKFTRQRDKLSKARRALPWEKVDKSYAFEGPAGRQTLGDLFGRHSQLIVYHFMFAPGATQGCPHCSFWADHYDAMPAHLAQRDIAFAVISRAPIEAIESFKRRMGWRFHWVSSGDTDFNYDFHASFHPEDLKSGSASYNYRPFKENMVDREGISVFAKDGKGGIFHTYSCYARGIDLMNGTYNFIDLTPKGRDEGTQPQSWVRYHDRYED